MPRKRNKEHEYLEGLIRAHGAHDEVAFVRVAGRLLALLKRRGEDVDDASRALAIHRENIMRDHSLDATRPCAKCGSMGYCRLWELKT